MKILYVTTVGQTMGFFISFIKELVEEGHTVDIACNEKEGDPVPPIYNQLGCRFYHIDYTRSPLSLGNLKAIKQLRRLGEENCYDIVHCHTPVAGVCTRIAFKNLRGKELIGADGVKHKVRVFYTAHGFHFHKGAPGKNWIIFYPIEKYCAKFTDVLITINREDYALAQKKFSNGGKCRIEYIPGVGIYVEKFRDVPGIEGGTGKANPIGDWLRGGIDWRVKRKELGVPEDAFLLLSVGELNENKNHQIVIRALAELMKTQEGNERNYHYVIAGAGSLKNQLQQIIDSLNLADRVKLLGHRGDCPELYKTADLFVHPSIREGLPVSVMEAEASGLLCSGSNIRGNIDIINKSMLFYPKEIGSVINILKKDSHEKNLYSPVGSEIVNREIKRLYKKKG